MKHTYPRIGDIRGIRKGNRLCAYCRKPGADKEIHVQIDHFRGDDGVHVVHESCLKSNNKDLFALGYR